jgi:membrane protein DedA with SNARE-associated domain
MLFPLLLIPFSLILPFVGATSFLPEISGAPTWVVPILVFGGAGLCGVVVVGGLLVWLGVKVKQRFDRDLANYKSKKSVYDNEDLPRWQRAIERWNQLYYCMRDETIFIPAENKAVKANDMQYLRQK